MKSRRAIDLLWALALVLTVLQITDAHAQRSTPVTVVNPDTNPVPVMEVGKFGFVGFSSGTIEGGQGLIAMHALCQTDFGLSSRVCTSKEFWLSPNAAVPIANSWLHSVGPTAGVDFTGITGATCSGWTNGDPSLPGMVVNTDGRPQAEGAASTCDIFRPVTCCAPSP